jgi:hypothetical protein
MAYSIKSSLLAWWLVLIISVFLWYRNITYDRILAAVAITVAMIQLIEYGLYNHMNPYQGGRMVFLVLFLIPFIFALSVLVAIQNIYALIWLIIVSIIFLFAVTYVFLSKDNEKFKVTRQDDYLVYNLSNMEWVILTIIMVPFFLLLSHYQWQNFGLYMILLYLVVSGLLIVYYLGIGVFPSIWSYTFVGVLFVCWVVNMFSI